MAQMHPIEAASMSPVCRHHWVIETPNGSVSSGRCKRCGVAREFRNSNEDMMWDSDSFSLTGSRSRGRRSEGAQDLS
ncbi:MAG TPA: hypothetical protein PKA49_12495 [Tepidiformaceae bacterium]|nr:hypothetical protein [Tepidiformaceae bacterium]